MNVLALCGHRRAGGGDIEGEGRPAPTVAGVHALARAARSHPTAIRLTVDGLAWALAVPAATALRFDLALHAVPWAAVAAGALLAAELHVAADLSRMVHRGRARYGTFEDVVHVGTCSAVVGATLFVLNVVLLRGMLPEAAPLLAAPVATVLMVLARAAVRMRRWATNRPDPAGATPVLVFGAGEAGARLVEAMVRDRHSPYVPVAVLDDDRRHHDLRILDVPVRGGREDLAAVVRETGATLLVVAVPSAPAELIRDLVARAASIDLDVRVLPPVAELVGGPGVADLRPVTDADLLGRREIDTDLAAVAGYVSRRRVLVTGAGGSIGSELCRQLARLSPSRLVLLDRDESALHAVQLSIEGRALLDSDALVVADIRDRARVDEVFERHRPHVVFHAAALKHLPLLELHPSEAVKTNVFGTINVLEAAAAHGVERFVNISTDKAADPISVLGYTKRIGERVTAAAAVDASRAYLSVRFGNVLGSRGSVLTAFRAQISAGGPLTVTDPDVTRYFMTVEEAVQLVIQAGAIGAASEVLVLDMGRPVRIAEVAERLVNASGRPIEIVYTGLRPGEKRHEVLFGRGEHDRRPVHPLISHVTAPPLWPHDLPGADLPMAAFTRRLPEIVDRAGTGPAPSPRPARGLAGVPAGAHGSPS